MNEWKERLQLRRGGLRGIEISLEYYTRASHASLFELLVRLGQNVNRKCGKAKSNESGGGAHCDERSWNKESFTGLEKYKKKVILKRNKGRINPTS